MILVSDTAAGLIITIIAFKGHLIIMSHSPPHDF